jgi:hypothetical protein
MVSGMVVLIKIHLLGNIGGDFVQWDVVFFNIYPKGINCSHSFFLLYIAVSG